LKKGCDEELNKKAKKGIINEYFRVQGGSTETNALVSLSRNSHKNPKVAAVQSNVWLLHIISTFAFIGTILLKADNFIWVNIVNGFWQSMNILLLCFVALNTQTPV
jgi:hypothetical protein